ncbi:zinc finger BED domain-containing protein DAYSLEEPER-like [Melitaea cinxia]|uniref:zinc finger BED domain-containing protein DAYSLEEPER-like n=1 Tax=Melitaea cinxia TaxID=113334 RepID=UPI001E2747D5|nr:zinc finger BED domain-containing protein DAYSLEEPER-like [Melitaea cinxia]
MPYMWNALNIQLTKQQVDKVKKIVTHIKKSTVAAERLHKYQVQQGQDPKRLCQAVETRWNSTYIMLKRFVELEKAIRATLAFADRGLPTINPDDWILYQQLCMVLQPFEEITASMSGEKYLTGSSVIIVTRCLKETCQKLLEPNFGPVVTDTVLLLKAGLEEKFRQIETSGTFSIATFLDPRFKLKGFSDQSEAIKTKEKVRKLVAAIIADQEKTDGPTTSSTVADTAETVSQSTGNIISPWGIFDQMVASTSSSGTPLSKAIKEIDMYLADELLPRKDKNGKLSCPLEWWKRHQFVYPNLKKTIHYPGKRCGDICPV